jgi:hypothetical protein
MYDDPSQIYVYISEHPNQLVISLNLKNVQMEHTEANRSKFEINLL